ncbi:extracellular solute-binding protein [Tranquillimonas rosea]|uniref:extracellular solute-binding protein n=1 Tax=Tranquillimonas rosea TaxID=641238 RepID=UPI003BAB6134
MLHATARSIALVFCLSPAVAWGQSETTTISHGVSAFGELKYPPDFPHFDYVNPDAPKGGEMSFRGVGASRTFDSLNPFILAGEPAQGLERIHDTLMARALDEPDAVYGLLAESVEYPADRGWVIFTLRPDAQFSDGHPVTAEDVVFTIETLKSEGSPLYRIQLEDVTGAEALSERRVRIDFRDGAATRDLPMEVAQIAILPAHYYGEVDFARSTLDPPVGSGPYEIADVRPGRSITYCRTPDYWGAEVPVNVGKDNFDCLRYEYFADHTAAFEALKAGEYLLHEEYFSAQWATGYDFPALNRGWVKQVELPDQRPSGAQGFYMNMRRAKLQDVRVRQAIAALFNFEWTNQTLFYGLYERTDSFWENSALEATGIPEGRELEILEEFRGRLPPEIFTEPPVSPPEGSLSQIDRSSVRRAGALLDEAGWKVGEDGLRRNEAGDVLRIEFVSDSPSFERVVLPYVDNLRRVGIDARYVQVDPAQMEERQKMFDYDITGARLVSTLTPSTELRTFFGSQSADQPGTYNLSGISDPVVDALIARAVQADNREGMVAAVHALDRVLRSKHLWVPNWYKGTHWLAYWDVFDRPETKPPYDRGVDFWWLDDEKYEAMERGGLLR